MSDATKSAPLTDATTSNEIGLGWAFVIYQQIASVVGAFALIVFFGHFVDFDWQGGIKILLDVWNEHVRPATKLVLDWTVVWFLRWAFDWHVEIPLIVRDYLAVGLTVFLSCIRVNLWHRARTKGHSPSGDDLDDYRPRRAAQA